ncbi:helix-turn-helix domain-containing protein [Streptomyces sp. NBC_01220]|uniref:helix-turn-helix domain-containing protein n=1 Tax=Streptomyces sp. NBC_01220 TaxID=2903781 RepID=UPI003D80A444
MGNVHEDPLSELGLRLRTLRAQRGLQVNGLTNRSMLGRTTVSQALGGKVVPSEATLVALAQALSTEPRPLLELRQDAVQGRGQERQLRRRQPSTGPHAAGHQARGDARERPGRLVRELRDPFDLEVQRAIDVSGGDDSDPLPVYVEREHDALLRETVLGALEGRSALVTLIGGSSTGKTRACWEAVQLLPDEWRLWHPIAPSHTDAVLAGLAKVGSHTVLWLNEVQHYLLTSDPAVGERVAAGLRELLRTPERGPVLALATAHPEDWARLTAASPPRDDYPHARALLTGSSVRVRIPDQFICDHAALEEAAQADPRVAEASAVAIEGRLTQYLAGVPALLERVGLASRMARCLLIAAVQLRRLGHGPMLPLHGLEATAASLTPDHIWIEHAPGRFLLTKVALAGLRPGPTAFPPFWPPTPSNAGRTRRIRAQALLSASRSGARTCAAGVSVTTAIMPGSAASANVPWQPSNAGGSCGSSAAAPTGPPPSSVPSSLSNLPPDQDGKGSLRCSAGCGEPFVWLTRPGVPGVVQKALPFVASTDWPPDTSRRLGCQLGIANDR